MTSLTNEPESTTLPATIAAAIEQRPLLRGTFHLAMAVVAPALFALLMLVADSPREYVGGAIYATTLMMLYTTSATYHTIPWRTPWRGVMMRLDHSMIFALIAGTYTPFCLLVVGDAWGISLLSVVWSFAGLGIMLKVAWPRAPRWLSVALYLALGWIGIVAAWPVITNIGVWGTLALLAGGTMYSIGAVCYAKQWPNPSPRYFGYHEVFHTLVIAGSITHFTLVAAYIFHL